jgi:mannose-6-phosphate isomerase
MNFMVQSDITLKYPNDFDLGRNVRKLVNQSIVERPWGSYEVLYEADTYKVKRVIVKSGKRISYQYHQNRSEHWTIVQGTGNFILDGMNRTVTVGDVLSIDIGSLHRIHNISTCDLIVIETQIGVCDESDIVRIDDDFNR